MESDPIKKEQSQDKVYKYILKEKTDAFRNMTLVETLNWIVKYSFQMASERVF